MVDRYEGITIPSPLHITRSWRFKVVRVLNCMLYIKAENRSNCPLTMTAECGLDYYLYLEQFIYLSMVQERKGTKNKIMHG